MRLQHIALVLLLFGFGGYIALSTSTEAMDLGENIQSTKPEDKPYVILGGGCFWCLESEFRGKDGILFTRVGYAGGHVKNPTYKDVTGADTGHAEVVEITYDPDIISHEDLLRFFFTKAHDPTQINRQGVDVGPQYRSIAFYKNGEEKQTIERIIDELNASNTFSKPIATQVEPETQFWLGEDYHQQYYEKYQEKNGVKHLRVILKEQKKALNK